MSGVSLSSSPRIRPAAATILLLALCLIVAGCNNPRVPYTPPDAYALSGGKIKHFTPTPGLPNSPTDRMLLAAVGLSRLKGSTARSAFVTFQSSAGNNAVGCLVIGNNVLVSLDELFRQGFGREQVDERQGSAVVVHGSPYYGKPFTENYQGEMFLYKETPQYMRVTPGRKAAIVGGVPVQLHHPVLWQPGADPLQGNHIMLLLDALRLFQERDRQMGSGKSIRNTKIIYDIRDYHR